MVQMEDSNITRRVCVSEIEGWKWRDRVEEYARVRRDILDSLRPVGKSHLGRLMR